MVVLAASICTRGGKAVLSRQFREMQRSRIEALLASFPKLADTGTQHTTVEQDNVRFVYQPLDELYMVLITNRQSNILQDIDSLHLFAQVVTSTCKTLDEREILKNAYELLSAFDELVTLGYRENLTISQIKTFLAMESHEERIQEIISRNKEVEATEQRKIKAKQLEMQRKEVSRSGRNAVPRTPVYPTYTPPTRSAVADTYDSYQAEKNKSYKASAPKGKGMQLGKKSKTTDMFERVRGDMGAEVEEASPAPSISNAPAPVTTENTHVSRMSTSLDRDAIHVTIAETINAKLTREGSLNSFEVKGDLQLRISDPTLTKVKLDLVANSSHSVQFRTHPNVDRGLFNSSRAVQMSNPSKGFPVNNSVGVLRWRATPKTDDTSAVPITFTVWVNKGSDDTYNITVEYELTGGDPLKDVTVIIPYATSEPAVSSFDATYEVSGDSLEWTIGSIDEENANGSFEFEAQAEDENEFFPMQVKFGKTRPFIDVDVNDVTLLEMNEAVTFSKEVKSVADSKCRHFPIKRPESITDSREGVRMEESPCLEKLGEKTLHQPANAHLIAYCPSMDLLALGSIDHQILIYRLNGQRVYGAAQKSDALGVESLWQLLAIAWADGTVRLIGAESSKTVHQFSTSDGDVSGITCMGWTTNLTTRNSSSTYSKISESWREFLEGDSILSENSTTLDLPRDLSLIDIETSLPKLSVLPAGGSSDDVFCSRSSLDPLFRPFDPKDNNAVDVMVVGTREGKIHLSIYDSFVVGSFVSPVLIQGSSSFLVRHASHEQYSTHSLLMKSSTSDETLYFVPMDLRFVSTSSDYLSLLASRSTALQNLLRYIHQVQILMATEWKSTQELPDRFLRNINETLAEKNDRDIVQALYHSVATGHTFSSVREWLVDELAERGHKRWDKAVITGLENLRRLVHENMLPALERCSAILSRLAGIAKFLGSNENVGFSSQDISLMMDTVACLHLVSSKILIQVVDELDLFTSFSLWLRYEIDRLASEVSTSPTEDVTDKEASIDHSKVLLYLQTAMTTGPLATFFDDASPEDSKDGWTSTEQGLPIFDMLSKQLQNQEQNLPYRRSLPKVELLCQRLTRQANAAFSQIAEAEKRNVLFGKVNKLGTAHKDELIDIRISRINHDSFRSFISFVPLGLPNQVQIIQVKLSVENGVSAVHSIDSTAVRLGDGQVKDLKFLDDDVLLVLWECNGLTSLLSIPYKSSNKDDDSAHAIGFYLTYYPHQPDAEVFSPMELNNDEVLRQLRQYTILKDESFIPEKMEIRVRDDDRSVNGRRLILLGKDRLRYLVLKWPGPIVRTRKPDVDVSMT